MRQSVHTWDISVLNQFGRISGGRFGLESRLIFNPLT